MTRVHDEHMTTTGTTRRVSVGATFTLAGRAMTIVHISGQTVWYRPATRTSATVEALPISDFPL